MHQTPLVSLALLAAAAGSAQAQTPGQIEFFEKQVRPLLVSKCQGCHNAKVRTSGLDLSTSAGFQQGGGGSRVLEVTSYEGKLKMPPTGKLSAEELATLKTWVEMGSPWPGATAAAAPKAGPAGRRITDADRQFWAFRPVSHPEPPGIKNPAWAKNAIDRFILGRLEEKGLQPAPPASKVTLLRRVTFDVTGLPPTEEEIRAFLDDQSPNAYAKVVDRLLASPRYGEQWGRHWLDIARYADSTGNDEDHRYPHAWRYRDYVIDAFNSDMPYDQFIREQIAGDLMPAPDGGVNRRGIIATGFLALGAKAIAQQDKKKMLYDVYDEQVDVTSKSIMGITLACARCHDHKFDPLLTRDYYSMVGMFASTKSFSNPDTHVSQLLFTPLVPAKEYEVFTRHQKRIQAKNTEIEDLLSEEAEHRAAPLIAKIADYMLAARRIYAEQKETGPHDELLDKWVDYLKPHGGRVYLEKWENASAEDAPRVAREYQDQFEKRFKAWTAELNAWREKFRASQPEDAPPRPKFEPATDRFFYEVFMQGPLAFKPKEPPPAVAALKKELADLKASLPPEPDMACAVQEGAPVQQKVFLRGDYNNLGPDALKVFPVVLAGDEQTPAQRGSGRLELANWMTRPDHPLTPRVMANRIWAWHFGEGIVRTPDNFGKMGERPTHPELLDYLASEFIRSGWSVKAMHRLILLSNTYQMSSTISDVAQQADPENRLFSRFPQRRLAVEEIRDALLAIDKTLDYTMGGTLQKGTGTDGENSSARLSLRPETSPRRLVYIPLRRANLPTLLNLFDFGDATTASGKRTVTTVAPQALFMMNSHFIAERAKNLAGQITQESDKSARVRALYLRVLNREAEPSEVDEALSYVAGFAAKRTESDAWFSLARILIASNEFIYLD